MSPIKIIMLGDSLDHNGGIATVERLILWYKAPTFDIHHITTHESGTVTHRIKVFSRGLAALIHRFLTQKIDLVHIHLADWGSVPRKAILALIAFLFRKPVIMHAHGPEFHLTYKALPTIAQIGLSWLFRRCSQFIVLSDSWKTFYMTHFNLEETRVVVLPNPIELPEPLPDRAQVQELIITFMGRIGQRKGAFDLIQAFSQLPVEYKQSTKLVFAGDGEVEQAKALVEQLHLSEFVDFLGWLSPPERDDLLSHSHIFVLPSYNEALPMALLEAMAWGLPVVTCPVGGIPEVVMSGENGLLVPPGNHQQLSTALQWLIADPSLRRSLGMAAYKSMADFDIRHYVAQLGKIYQSCMANCS